MLRQFRVVLSCREIHLILYNRNIRIKETLLKVMSYWLDGHDLGFYDFDGIWVAARLPARLTAGKDTPEDRKRYIHDDKADRRPEAEPIHSRLTVVAIAWVRGVDVIHSCHLRDTCEQEHIDSNYRTFSLFSRYQYTISRRLLFRAKASYLYTF